MIHLQHFRFCQRSFNGKLLKRAVLSFYISNGAWEKLWLQFVKRVNYCIRIPKLLKALRSRYIRVDRDTSQGNQFGANAQLQQAEFYCSERTKVVSLSPDQTQS